MSYIDGFVIAVPNATRDAGMDKVMKDPRMDAASEMPFDGRRMIFGSFVPVVSLPG